MTDIYKTAARRKLRFDTGIGSLTVEQLFGLPLTSKSSSAVTLDSISRELLAEQKTFGGESLVAEANNPREAVVELSIEILKDVIVTEQARLAAVARRATRSEERSRLLDALRNREDKDLSEASKDDLVAKLAEIDAAEDDI